MRQDVSGNVDQITAQFTFAPLTKYSTLFHGRHAQVFHQRISLANQLHVGVFNAVVNHLHKVSSAAGAHPFAAG